MKTRILLTASVLLTLAACGVQNGSANKLTANPSGRKMNAAERAAIMAAMGLGGQPGLITLKGVAVGANNQPDSHIKVTQDVGNSLQSKVAKISDDNLPSYGTIDDTNEQAQLDKLIDDTTYINMGCDLSKIDPNLIHGLKDATAAFTAANTAAAASAAATTGKLATPAASSAPPAAAANPAAPTTPVAAPVEDNLAPMGYSPKDSVAATNASADADLAPDVDAVANTAAAVGTNGKTTDCTKDSAAKDLVTKSTTISAKVVLMCSVPANMPTVLVEISADNLVMTDLSYSDSNSQGGIYMTANTLTLNGVNTVATSGVDSRSIVGSAPYIQLDVAKEISGTGSLGLSSTGGNAIGGAPTTPTAAPAKHHNNNNPRPGTIPTPNAPRTTTTTN